jgi:cytidylate kinase
MIKCVFINHKLKVLNHQLPKVIINNKKKIKIFLFFSVLTRARRLERELEDAEERAEMVTTTLIRSRSVHRTTDYD